MDLHYDVGIMMTRTQLSFERRMLKRAQDRAGKLGINTLYSVNPELG